MSLSESKRWRICEVESGARKVGKERELVILFSYIPIGRVIAVGYVPFRHFFLFPDGGFGVGSSAV